MSDAETQLNPKALSVADAARLLGVERELVERDVAAGAPVNPDGTLSLVVYAAWLNLKLAEDDGAAT